MSVVLPTPPHGDTTAIVAWVGAHLGDLVSDAIAPSPRFRGGQRAADAALAAFDVGGYATRRSGIWPPSRRGASALSPYIRHGLLPLPHVWDAVAGGPARDVAKYRDELLWQEYARHLYARLGRGMARPLRADPPARRTMPPGKEVWDPQMACMAVNVEELERDGYLVNQARLWLASHWSVRMGADWREGERRFFRHLLCGSRAANRAGWQWAIGTGTGRPYGFSRAQVERQAPGLCAQCALQYACPIARPPREGEPPGREPDPRLRRDPDPERTGGPRRPTIEGRAEAVWLTAESLGDADPALDAHPELPAIFVFDAPLLARLRLSGKRLVFLAECLADLAARRPLTIYRGEPVAILAERALATTFAPVPGWRARAARLDLVEVHPWPWLRRPHSGSVQSFSAWSH